MTAVGAVTATTARIWARMPGAGTYQFRLSRKGSNRIIAVPVTVPASNPSDNTHSVEFRDLVPQKRHTYSVVRTGGHVVGRGAFETAPEKQEDTPGKFSIGVMSCHQPFNDDGAVSGPRMRLLKVSDRILKDHDAKAVIYGGDQIYSDSPHDCRLTDPHFFSAHVVPSLSGHVGAHRSSLLACSEAEVRRIYQQRYRIFWNVKPLQKLYANYPSYPMWDDHEIIDDWGVHPDHKKPQYASLLTGAKLAYMDYQATKVRSPTAEAPIDFHYAFEYGTLGVFVFDIRSNRKTYTASATLYNNQQLVDFKRWLEASRDKHVLLIVTSVPVFHLSQALANIGGALGQYWVDFRDHWAYKKNVVQRDKVLSAVYEHQKAHPGQKVAFVGGDVHIGNAFGITWGRPERTIYQFTSSAISNRQKAAVAALGALGPQHNPKLKVNGDNGTINGKVELLKGVPGASDNPFGGLNLGIIELNKVDDTSSTVRFKLMNYGGPPYNNPVAKFDSGPL